MNLSKFQELIKNSSLNVKWTKFDEPVPSWFLAVSYTDNETLEIGFDRKWHISRFNEVDQYLAQYGQGKTLEQAINNYSAQRGLS